MGLTCIINKASVGFLKPCDVVERLYLNPALEPRCVEDCLAELPALTTGNELQITTNYMQTKLNLMKLSPGLGPFMPSSLKTDLRQQVYYMYICHAHTGAKSFMGRTSTGVYWREQCKCKCKCKCRFIERDYVTPLMRYRLETTMDCHSELSL